MRKGTLSADFGRMQALLDDQLVKAASLQALPFIGPLESIAGSLHPNACLFIRDRFSMLSPTKHWHLALASCRPCWMISW